MDLWRNMIYLETFIRYCMSFPQNISIHFSGHNSMCCIISPTSLLLSATGTLAFKNCTLSDEAMAFTAPEMLQGRASSTKPAIEKVSIHALCTSPSSN